MEHNMEVGSAWNIRKRKELDSISIYYIMAITAREYEQELG